MALPTQPPRFTGADGSPIRVLVVEDEPSLTGLLSMAMRYEGWDVTTANSGAHAVHEAQATRPDVIVLDMRLPDFDGLEVMRQIRMNQPTVPAVFLTAKDAISGRIAGLTAGGDESPNLSPSKRSSPGYAPSCAVRGPLSPSPTPC